MSRSLLRKSISLHLRVAVSPGNQCFGSARNFSTTLKVITRLSLMTSKAQSESKPNPIAMSHPYLRPAVKRASGSKRTTFIHDPPIPVSSDAIFFKSNGGKGGFAFLSNYWPFVKDAVLRGCASAHDIHPPVNGKLFTIDGFEYKSVEHFYQAERQQFGKVALKTQIREAVDADSARRINVAHKKSSPSSLSARDERNLIRRGLLAKFTQNEQLRKVLLATGTRALHEGAGMGASYNRWVLTHDGTKGGDLLGQLLMEVRAELAAAAK